MWTFIGAWLLVGCVVSFLFFKVLDKMMKDHPNKDGATSVGEMISFSVDKNTEIINRKLNSGIVKFAMVSVSVIIWPLFAVLLIWMATWV